MGGFSVMAFSNMFTNNQDDQANTNSDLPVVYASTYPLYSVSSELLEGVAEVKLVSATGDVHDFEPSTRDITDLSTSKAFVYNGADLDTWVDSFKPQLEQNGLKIINTSANIELIEATEGHGHHGHSEGEDNVATSDTLMKEENGEEHGNDPHYWLSPAQMVIASDFLYNEFKAMNFGQDQVLEGNFNQLKSELENLDQDFRTGLGTDTPESCDKREILLSHNFLQYVANDYGFDLHTVLGNSPEGELSVSETNELVEEIKEEELRYLLEDGEVSEALVSQIVNLTEVTRLEFSTLERVPENYQELSYTQIQRDNLEKLETAMGCQN